MPNTKIRLDRLFNKDIIYLQKEYCNFIKDEKKKTINVFHSKQLLLWQFYHFGIADNACDCNGNYGIEGKQDCYKLFNQIKTKKFVNCFVT